MTSDCRTIAAWAIRKHLDFVSTFSFHARTDDDDLNMLLERKMAEWRSIKRN
jgi:hypothetical protein